MAGHLFDSRNEWFEHERDHHRSEWRCTQHGIFDSRESFRRHIENDHPDLGGPVQQQAIIDITGHFSSEMLCPLCGNRCQSPQKLRSHLGRHLQQIALFVLPSAEGDDGSSSDGKDERDVKSDGDERQEATSDLRDVDVESEDDDAIQIRKELIDENTNPQKSLIPVDVHKGDVQSDSSDLGQEVVAKIDERLNNDNMDVDDPKEMLTANQVR